MKVVFYLAIILLFFSAKVDCQELSLKKAFIGFKMYEGDTQINKDQFKTLLKSYPESEKLWNRSRTNLLLGWVALGADAIIFKRYRTQYYEQGDFKIIPNVLSLAVVLRFFVVSRRLRKNAILKYNEQFDTGQIRISPSQNGLGIVLNF